MWCVGDDCWVMVFVGDTRLCIMRSIICWRLCTECWAGSVIGNEAATCLINSFVGLPTYTGLIYQRLSYRLYIYGSNR